MRGFLGKEGELLSELPGGVKIWDSGTLFYHASKGLDYLVEVNVPLDYPIWSDVKIISEFTNTGNVNLPILSYINADSKFEVGKPYRISIGFENNGLKDVKVYYATAENNWELANVDNPFGEYKYSVIINDNSIEKISLRIEAETNSGISKWLIKPIALRARETDIDLSIYQRVGERQLLSGKFDPFGTLDIDGDKIKLTEIDAGIYVLSVNGESELIGEEDYLVVVGDYVFVISEKDEFMKWIIFDAYKSRPSLDVIDANKEVYIIGRLSDEKKESLGNVVLDLYLNDVFVDKEITGFGKVMIFDREGNLIEVDHINNEGVFFHKYNDIKNMARVRDSLRIKANFEGTGVYLPKEEEFEFSRR